MKKKCVWDKKGYCLVKECIKDCDLKELKYKKIEVLNQINKEIMIMESYHKKGIMKRKEKEMNDKIMGVIVMMRILKREFGYSIKKLLDEMKTNNILKRKIIMYIEKDKRKRLV